jgi:hypothetical protein
MRFYQLNFNPKSNTYWLIIKTFAWSHKELRGISKEICEHKIELMAYAQPIKQRHNDSKLCLQS